MKTGLKSTEFWMTAGVILAGLLKQIQMPPWAYAAATITYTVIRGIAKTWEIKE